MSRIRGGHPELVDLTTEEVAAMKALQAIAKKWPKSLWLFSASGSLEVMRCGEDGERVHISDTGIDPDYVVGSINIPNDGGDW